MTNKDWYKISNVDEIDSPALLIYPDRVEENVRRMIKIAGGAHRLRPHVKTHKLAQLMRMQLDMGITKFKCATIAEAEMVANCNAPDLLLAYQPIGPKLHRFIHLAEKFPRTNFSTIADDENAIRALSQAAAKAGLKIPVLVDIDCGMHRCGVPAGPKAIGLYRLIASLPGLKPGGLHVYDGHIQDSDLSLRTKNCEAAFAPAAALSQELCRANLPVPRIVAGGTPTFPIHATKSEGVTQASNSSEGRVPNLEFECSPGTCVLWDAGYGIPCTDLDFLHAALVLTRVISKPANNLLCLDLGHKAIAAEKPHPRVIFPEIPDAKAITHSEEHLVIETAQAGEFKIGDCLYGIPLHICPTVALHSHAVIVKNGATTAKWEITARNRTLTV